MERLNKRQKELLECLKKVYPNSLNREVLLRKLGHELKDISVDIELLYQNELVIVRYENGASSMNLTIAPKGIEKLQETFRKRLGDSAHKNPWAVIAIVVSLILGLTTLYYYFENIELQNQIKHENELKQNQPPTISLKQEYRKGSSGELEITPKLYSKKYNDKLFFITFYYIRATLNGKEETIVNGGRYVNKSEGIGDEEIALMSFYPETVNYTEFDRGINDLIINYELEITDMDSQISYRGNVTTELPSYSKKLDFPSGSEPVIFKWIKI